MDSSKSPQAAHDVTGTEIEPAAPETVQVRPKDDLESPVPSSGDDILHTHGTPEQAGDVEAVEQAREKPTLRSQFSLKRKGWGEYVKTKEFWIVLVLGQVLSLLLTSTNTFTQLLSIDGVSIPAFQNLFNYCVLGLAYTSFTLYKYGFKKWGKMVVKDGWRYIIFAFIDVEGNYFFVLAYRYTTILSCTLIDFWAIVIVVGVSLIFLKVRYHITQYIGIFICVGGLGVLLGSDHITGYNQYPALDAVKGDLFALLGATFYGFSNIYQEFLVSKRPIYEVIGQLGLWGSIINGVQAAIFDRNQFKSATWTAADGGYLTGYTLSLASFYTITPLMFRMASAAFFNISLLTSDFWSVIIGLQRFHLTVHWMYPIAFVLIISGLLVYFLTESIMGEAKKPWLGDSQEKGVNGVGTARRKILKQGHAAEDESTA